MILIVIWRRREEEAEEEEEDEEEEGVSRRKHDTDNKIHDAKHGNKHRNILHETRKCLRNDPLSPSDPRSARVRRKLAAIKLAQYAGTSIRFWLPPNVRFIRP
eukprot:6978360-Pyramimonas_sp.AAC.1